MNLPKRFEDSMRELLKDEYDEYINSYEDIRTYGLRVNTGKISADEFEKICPFKIKKIPWIDNGYYYDKEAQPSKHPYYYAGLYYLQEPSAMTPASRLNIDRGDNVLDLCAAPGGKATELGARLEGEGLLVANDISNSRAKALLKNIELFGIYNACVVSEAPDKLSSQFAGFFDKILIDAPCSGEGMFRKDPAIIKNWEVNQPEYYAQLQKDIVKEAVKMLKSGGELLYSTCTFSPKENEDTVQYIMDIDNSMELIAMKGYEGFSNGLPEFSSGNEELKKCVRIWPHKMTAEGHFMALLKKKGGKSGNEDKINDNYECSNRINKAELEAAGEFLKLIDREFDSRYLTVKNQNVYYLPKGLKAVSKIRFLRTGLLLGEIKKNRFEPSQALAMSLRPSEFSSVVSLRADDVRCIKYLKGETIDIGDIEVDNKSGWQLICVEDYPLGFGKLNKGILKNKYYAGWRWQ